MRIYIVVYSQAPSCWSYLLIKIEGTGSNEMAYGEELAVHGNDYFDLP